MSVKNINDNMFIFSSEELGCQIKGLFDNDVPMLNLTDVVHGLGYVAVNKSQEKKCRSIRHYDFPTKSGIRQMPFINLNDCDVLIRGARLKRWKLMEKWFADEILPSLKQMKPTNVVQVEQIEEDKVEVLSDTQGMLEVKSVPFMGTELMAAKDENGTIWAGVRWMCDGMGLSRNQRDFQTQKIKSDKVVSKGAENFQLLTAGGKQNILCLNLDFVPMWLAKINITPAMQEETPELAERLEAYQLEAAKVLAAAFLKPYKTESYTTQFTSPVPDPIVSLIDTYTRDLKVAVATEVQKIRNERDRALEENNSLKEQLNAKNTLRLMPKLVKFHPIEINKESLKETSTYCRAVLRNKKKGLALSKISEKYGSKDYLFNVLDALEVHAKIKNIWTPNDECLKNGYAVLVELPEYSFYSWTKLGQLYLYELLKENGILPFVERKELTE